MNINTNNITFRYSVLKIYNIRHVHYIDFQHWQWIRRKRSHY